MSIKDILWKFFPLTVLLILGCVIAGMLGYSKLSKYLGALSMIGFVVTFMIPATLSDWKKDWRDNKGALIYTIIFYILFPIALMLWGIFSGVIDKMK